jgi:predicted ATPase
MRHLPTGTVTFLFSDIEGSTRLLLESPDGYADLLASHRRALRDVFAAHSGNEVDTQGDAFFYVFASAKAAAAAAEEVQRVTAGGPLRDRIGLHTGEPLLTADGYVGIDVHRAARIGACGHGGQVLLSEQTQKLLGERPNLRDLGLHVLKDLQAAERILQLGDGDFPPLRSLNQTNLPVQPTPFVGRERELAELLGVLRRNDVRLLTLVGPGGSGKTRLGLQAAAELAGDYPGGVWFVSVAAQNQPDLLLATIARTLGLREAGGETLEQILTRHLRDRRLLLLVDNVEQLLPAAAHILADLLRSAAHLRLLVTSREPLRVSAEHEYGVSPLLIDEALELFADRVRAVQPEFELRAESRAVADAICARVDRLPLAIELAAPWVKLLSLEELLARLNQRLPLLVGGARDAPARQQTLRATIGWSFDLLGDEERRVFAQLAVFRGGCTLEAAELVCGAGLDTLASLLDRSLFRRELGGGGGLRYTMLETIREFALDQLEKVGASEPVRRRHAEYFVTLGEVAEPELRGKNQAQWLDRLEAEHANLRSAVQWLLDHGQPDLALQLAGALWMFWYMHGHIGEGRRWLMSALAATEPVPTEARARALDGAGYLACEQGDVDEGIRLVEESLSCARSVGSDATTAIAATHLGVFLVEKDATRANALCEEAVVLARQTGDRQTLAVALNNLAEVARELGDNARATALHEESHRLRREIGDASRIALSLLNLGELALIAGELDRARSLTSEALKIARPLGDKRHISLALGNLGWVALSQGRGAEAGGRFREALVMFRELGNARESVSTLYGLAGVAALDGDADRTARLGAAADTNRAMWGHVPGPLDAGIHVRLLDAARALTDAVAWQAAGQEGSALSLDEAVDYAL